MEWNLYNIDTKFTSYWATETAVSVCTYIFAASHAVVFSVVQQAECDAWNYQM